MADVLADIGNSIAYYRICVRRSAALMIVRMHNAAAYIHGLFGHLSCPYIDYFRGADLQVPESVMHWKPYLNYVTQWA